MRESPCAPTKTQRNPKNKVQLKKKSYGACSVGATRASLRRLQKGLSEEGGAPGSYSPAPQKEQQSHSGPQSPPSCWWGPVPSASGATGLTEDASGDLGPRLSPSTSEHQMRGCPKAADGESQIQRSRRMRAGEDPSALCAFPEAGGPGGSVPEGVIVKHMSEQLLKTFSESLDI